MRGTGNHGRRRRRGGSAERCGVAPGIAGRSRGVRGALPPPCRGPVALLRAPDARPRGCGRAHRRDVRRGVRVTGPVLVRHGSERGGRALRDREVPPEDYERIEDLVDFAPLRAALAEALETLAVDQREALKLRVIDGLPYPEVAAQLQCAETAARQRVSRGLRRLALVLQESGLMLTSEVD